MKNLYKIIYIFFFFFCFNFTDVKAETVPACSPNYTNASGEINLGAVPGYRACMTEAAAYELTIYEVHLCTSEPTAPTAASAIVKPNCTLVFQNSAGSTINLSATGSESLVGETFKPPAGNYTHAYLKLDNVIGITGKVNFSDKAYDGQASQGSGTTCATRDTAQENATSTANAQNTSLCGNSDITAGKKLIQLQSLDCCDGVVVARTTDNHNNINGSGQSGQPSLVDTNGLLITSEAQAEFIDYIATFGRTIVISDNLTNLNLSFNVSSALEVSNQDADIIKFMFGAPQIIIETTHSSS